MCVCACVSSLLKPYNRKHIFVFIFVCLVLYFLLLVVGLFSFLDPIDFSELESERALLPYFYFLYLFTKCFKMEVTCMTFFYLWNTK